MVVNQIDNNNYQRTHKYTVYYQDIPTQQHTVMVVNQTDKKQLSTTSQTYSVLSRHTSSTPNSNGLLIVIVCLIDNHYCLLLCWYVLIVHCIFVRSLTIVVVCLIDNHYCLLLCWYVLIVHCICVSSLIIVVVYLIDNHYRLLLCWYVLIVHCILVRSLTFVVVLQKVMINNQIDNNIINDLANIQCINKIYKHNSKQ
jgi:hypothetical protein